MRRALVIVACLAAVIIPAPAASAEPAPALDWHPCGGDSQCARLVVPLDYADPDGPTISIAVRRTPATGERLGALIANPGGPGVPGRDFGSALAWELPDSVSAAYDLIGFDPRGVGRSSAIRCLTQRQLRPWLRADATPDTPSEERRFAELAREFGTSCQEKSGDLLPHVNSRAVARDLDMLRIALGEQSLNFVGASYGTYLGAMYADQFPERVGRLVLDGAIDPRDDQVGLTDGQIDGFDDAATRMAAWCAQRRDCPVPGRSTRAVLRSINSLLAGLDDAPLPAGQGPPLRQQEAITAILSGLYDAGSWRYTLTASGAAIGGDGTGLALMGRGFLTSSAQFLSAFLAISCSDSPAPPGRDGVSQWARERAAHVRVPELARYLAWSVLPCASWPVHVDEPPGPVRAPGAAPILVIGTTHDPATPMAWARSLARQLDSGVLLTRVGDGHTAIGSGSRCVSRAVAAYLVNGVLPEPGTVCR